MAVAARIAAYKDTKRQAPNYKSEDHKVVQLVEPDDEVTTDPPSEVRVYSQCAVDLCITATDEGASTIMVVEMNSNYPGPSLEAGGLVGVESEIWLRSNICQILKDNNYPMPNDQLWHFPELTIFKDAGYENLKEAYALPVLGVRINPSPSVQYEQKDGRAEERYADEKDRKHMKQLIYSIFDKVYNLGHICVILPDLGCEIGHPIDDVVEIFQKAIIRYPIPLVVFAMLPYRDFPKKLTKALVGKNEGRSIVAFTRVFRE